MRQSKGREKKNTYAMLGLNEDRDASSRRMAQQGKIKDFFQAQAEVQSQAEALVPARLCAARLSKRTVIAVEGEDALGFIEDLTTNSLARTTGQSNDANDANDGNEGGEAGGALATAFLTAQGTLRQFCLAVRTPRGLLLECDRARLDVFAETLWKARLGRAVSFRWMKEMQVVALFPAGLRQEAGEASSMERSKEMLVLQDETSDVASDAAGYLFVDPRAPMAAMRIWHLDALDMGGLLRETALPTSFCWVEEADYEFYRLALGVIECAEEWGGAMGVLREQVLKHALPFAFGLDALGVMDWQKDCYVGQEIAARLKYRARVAKKHALPVRLSRDEGAAAGGVVRGGDKVFIESKGGGERLCGEVLYSVAGAGQRVLLVLFNLAALGIASLLTERRVSVVCGDGERLGGEVLLPSWLGELWGAGNK